MPLAGGSEDFEGDVSRARPHTSWIAHMKRRIPIVSTFLHGVIFWLRYHWRHYVLDDLDRCIECWERCLQTGKNESFMRILIANSLGSALTTRFTRKGVLGDLDSSIFSFQEALAVSPPGSQCRVLCLNNLGGVLGMRFSWRRTIADIDRSIGLLTEAVDTCSPPKKLSLRSKIWNLLKEVGAASVIDDYPLSLMNLGDAYLARYRRSSQDMADVEKAIDFLCRALECRQKSRGRAMVLNSLSSALLSRFGRTKDDADIKRSIELLEEVLRLFPRYHPSYPGYVISLAATHLNRCQITGTVNDVEEAMKLMAQVMEQRYPGHPKRYNALRVYGDTYFLRFQTLGSLSDLQSSIRMYNESIELSTPEQLVAEGTLNHLSSALKLRFDRHGSTDDVKRAIQLDRRALELCARDHADYAHNLILVASSEFRSYQTFGDFEALEQAIEKFQTAIAIIPSDDSIRDYALSKYGDALFDRSQLRDSREDLDKAIESQREAVRCSAPGGLWRQWPQNSLATALILRYQLERNATDLREAIALHRNLLAGSRKSPKPERAETCRNLADALLEIYELEHDPSVLDEAMQLYSEGASYLFSSARPRMFVILRWLEVAHKYALPKQASLAYPAAISLFPRLMRDRAHLDSAHRLWKMRDIQSLPRDAAMHMLLHEGVDQAVELMEQGRGMFWNYSLDLRSPFEDLPEDLQRELRETVDILETDSNSHSELRAYERERLDQRSEFAKERDGDRRREAAHRFEQLLAEARTIPGCERLLMPKTYKELSAAAKRGPVVVLLASVIHGCAAVLIRSDSHGAERVLLPNINVETLERMVRDVSNADDSSKSFVERGAADDVEFQDSSRKIIARKRIVIATDPFKNILAQLWRDVVAPIISVLGAKKATDMSRRPRLWWCPTGPFVFLPIHAAGVDCQLATRDSASDYIVSSYTPTLRILIDAQVAVADRALAHSKALLLAQPNTPGLPNLPNTLTEIENLAKLFSSESLLRLRPDPSASFSETNSSVTIAEVTDKIAEASIVHLACHGNQAKYDPLDSGFALQDGVMRIESLIKMKTPHAFFAFLSACETASGDRAEPDENIHLSSGMIFAGFLSVIGTMWPMNDHDGPVIARHVYERMLESNTSLANSDAIAYALDESTRGLRDQGLSAGRWATYIHMGI